MAMREALNDAGLTPADIDGVLTNQPLNDPKRCHAVDLAGALGIQASYLTDLAAGGATPVMMLQHAVMAIQAGLCETVICVHARKSKTGYLEPKRGDVRDGWDEFEVPFGLHGALPQHAVCAQRHMYEYGTTSVQLGEIALACRYHASLNPAATMREPLTLEDHQSSRWIVEPLHLLDCCLVSDGGGAFIVTNGDRAVDFPKKPVFVRGMGQFHPHGTLMEAQTLTTIGAKRSSEKAYQLAELRPSDIDFAEIYDCFTITVLMTLEGYGFCPIGEGGNWVQGGRIRLAGDLPVNTHGGLLSQAHIEGMLHITEAVKQLRGGEVEPARQVRNAHFGIVSGHGCRLSTHSTVILSDLAS